MFTKVRRWRNCIRPHLHTFISRYPTAHLSSGPLRYWGFLMTHKRPAGLIWTRNQPVAEAITQQTQETNMHVLSGIQTRDPCSQVIADLRFRQHSQRNRPVTRDLRYISLYHHIYIHISQLPSYLQTPSVKSCINLSALPGEQHTTVVKPCLLFLLYKCHKKCVLLQHKINSI